jgi:hypothetical protein
MQQLTLFLDAASADAVEPEAPAPATVPAFAEEESPAAGGAEEQLGLFEQRTLRLARAEEAISRGRLAEARRTLQELRKQWPEDAGLRHAVERVASLQRRFRWVDELPAPARPSVLLAAARELEPARGPWADLRALLLRRLAAELREVDGDHGELEGQLPGYYLIEAGALAEARASLMAAAAARRRARPLYLLADIAFLQGEIGAARRLYLEALLEDPFDAALASVRDVDIRTLPELASEEYEMQDQPAAWCAPVGILSGALPSPAALGDGALSLLTVERALPPVKERREALSRARAFVQALAAASSPAARRDHDLVIEARRAMKRLAPQLFAAYLRRIAAAQGQVAGGA